MKLLGIHYHTKPTSDKDQRMTKAIIEDKVLREMFERKSTILQKGMVLLLIKDGKIEQMEDPQTKHSIDLIDKEIQSRIDFINNYFN